MLKKLLAAAVFASVSATAAAVPMTFTVGVSITQGYGNPDFAGEGGQYTILPDGSSLVLDPGSSEGWLDLEVIGGRLGTVDEPWRRNFLQLFSAGSTVSSASLGTGYVNDPWAYALYYDQALFGWEQSFTGKYIGFETKAGRLGYIGVDWTFDPRTAVGTLTLGTGAVESVAGAALTIPGSTEVPEPASLALLGLGLLGVGAARRRRG